MPKVKQYSVRIPLAQWQVLNEWQKKEVLKMISPAEYEPLDESLRAKMKSPKEVMAARRAMKKEYKAQPVVGLLYGEDGKPQIHVTQGMVDDLEARGLGGRIKLYGT